MEDIEPGRRPRPLPSNEMSRRVFLGGAVATPLVISACRARPRGSKASRPGEFSLTFAGTDVRCLYYDQLISGDQSGCLLIVLLHGSGADATQWIDIGLVDAVDNLRLGSGVRRVVAVAPDIADHARAPALVTDALLPHVDHRFGPGMLAISGISRGAGEALDVARDPNASMRSVGLHSPAIHLRQPIEPAGWTCFLDVGNDDPLASSAADTAADLRRSGIAVSEHRWPGGHDRRYWRRHLPDYLAFHVATAQRSSA